MDDLQKIVAEWCNDDNEKNILYKKSGEERYPNFKLYKMIARSVHNHVPIEQLKNPIFKQFLTEEKSMSVEFENYMDIDSIPCYV
jgi:hypothetical protein